MDKILWDEGETPSRRIRRTDVPPVQTRASRSALGLWALAPMVLLLLLALGIALKPTVDGWLNELSRGVATTSHNNLRPVNP